jgi:hypothetical protein
MSTPKNHQFSVFLPLVSTPAKPEFKAGYAPSSHQDLAERIRLLGGVSAVRGWKLGNNIPDKLGGADYTPCWWCDMSAEKRGGKIVIRDQMHVISQAAKRDTELLFLNEPDMAKYGRGGQCDISPHRAAVLYLYARETAPDVKLIGLGLSHLDYLNGFQFLGAFIDKVAALSGSLPDFWAWDTHNYIDNGDPLAPIDALQTFLHGRGIVANRFYISEWGACTPDRVGAMRRAFDGDARIIRHYYYCQYEAVWDGEGRCTSLFVEGSKPLRLSPLGEAWVAAGQ